MSNHIMLSNKETNRIAVLDQLVSKTIKQKDAAKLLRLSTRQLRRIIPRYKNKGVEGITHLSRGKQSNHKLSQSKCSKITELIKNQYIGFGPTLAAESLAERDNINYSVETIRKIMVAENLWISKRKNKNIIHIYRDRRECFGELVQLDGSPHDWFEGRSEKCTLIAFIDDATSEILDGGFVDYEGIFPYFEVLEHYLKKDGKPLSLYVDQHSTFKITRQPTLEEELKDGSALSQFGRACEELKIELIFASSAEAKGRVERLFETLQDRLVKLMRLEGIQTKEEATKYFREVYLPKHNHKFAVVAKEAANLHRSLNQTDNLDRIFTIKSFRVVSKTLTISYKGKKYQLLPNVSKIGIVSAAYGLRGSKVNLEEDRNGGVCIYQKEQKLEYQMIPSDLPKKAVQVVSAKDFQERRVYIPGPNHPWRQKLLNP